MTRIAALGLAAPLPGVAIQATGNSALHAPAHVPSFRRRER
jgi:hypothetical protein